MVALAAFDNQVRDWKDDKARTSQLVFKFMIFTLGFLQLLLDIIDILMTFGLKVLLKSAMGRTASVLCS